VFATQDKGWFWYTMTNHGRSVHGPDVTPDLFADEPDGSNLTMITHTAAEQRPGSGS
jgi:hypothetical protein